MVEAWDWETRDGLVTQRKLEFDETKRFKIIDVFLDQLIGSMKVPETFLVAAARNLRFGEGVMRLLLDQRGDKVKITEAVVESAAGNEENGGKVMGLLFEKGGNKVKITEEILKAAAGNIGRGKEVMELLLEQPGNEVKVTEAVVQVAARNGRCGKRVMKVLLSGMAEVEVTNRLVDFVAVAFGEEMELLLKQSGDEVKVTEEAVKTAA
ncbi:hypothetical protein LZ31DRAFT_536970 [Colletotrichum somersetense]|nr:hypothetical protein LZ31DRAFT_536970 [Colletotrichum somersetense]